MLWEWIVTITPRPCKVNTKCPINTATTHGLQKNPTHRHTKSKPTRNLLWKLPTMLCGKSWVLTCLVAGLWIKPEPTQEFSLQKQTLHVSCWTVCISLLFLSLLSCYLETMGCYSVCLVLFYSWDMPKSGIFTASFFLSIRSSWIEACANTIRRILSEKPPSLLTQKWRCSQVLGGLDAAGWHCC